VLEALLDGEFGLVVMMMHKNMLEEKGCIFPVDKYGLMEKLNVWKICAVSDWCGKKCLRKNLRLRVCWFFWKKRFCRRYIVNWMPELKWITVCEPDSGVRFKIEYVDR